MKSIKDYEVKVTFNIYFAFEAKSFDRFQNRRYKLEPKLVDWVLIPKWV